MKNKPEPNKPNWAAAAERIEVYLGDASLYGNFVRLRILLANLFEKTWPTIDEGVFGAGFDYRNPKLPLKNGDLRFDHKIIRSLSDEVAAGLAEIGPINEEIATLLAYAKGKEDFLASLTTDAVFHWDDKKTKDLAEQIGSPHYALISYGRILATPFLVWAARHIDRHMTEAVDQSAFCPICGAAPAYVRHGRNDGRWLLVCSLCETHWEMPPRCCPFCGCLDQEKLGALMVADDAVRPIMTCDECRNYIKTVDERKLPEDRMIIPFEEDTITLPYDMLAEREGYKRPHY